jgi:hypothetical protein
MPRHDVMFITPVLYLRGLGFESRLGVPFWNVFLLYLHRKTQEREMKFRIVFWDVLPCKIIVDRRFRGTCCLHHTIVPLKRRSTIILHGSTYQKTILNFILTAVRTWNLTTEKDDKYVNIHALSGIRTHYLSVKAIKAYASDRAASGTGVNMISFVYNFNLRLKNVIRMAMGYRNKHVYKEGRLGGVVISVLAAGPKGRGFKPGRGDEFLRAIKIRSTPSFGW